MSVANIPESVKIRLWGKAAGRCEYEGCNEPLWLDQLTKAEFNTAYIAHIIADSPGGPRGDAVLSEQLEADISNLMLLCDVHHRLIDKKDMIGHPVERLRKMKADHERRVEIVAGIGADRQSHVLLYGANIGIHSSPISYQQAAEAMLPERYPADTTPILLNMVNSSFRDDIPDFWDLESRHLHAKYGEVVRSRLQQGAISHLSVFARAPQPLLMLLGTLLCDIVPAEVYQPHREPPSWRWQDGPADFDYAVHEPDGTGGAVALVFALSATVVDSRVTSVVGADTAIWRVTVDYPNNDMLRSKEQSEKFRQVIRRLLDRMKAKHGEDATVHVFPVMPAALAVEFGRVIMPKADLPMRIYDENKKLGGFRFALDLNAKTSQGGD